VEKISVFPLLRRAPVAALFGSGLEGGEKGSLDLVVVHRFQPGFLFEGEK
jgi:hypothetical protein